jgi:hypothetical protein
MRVFWRVGFSEVACIFFVAMITPQQKQTSTRLFL